jgi:hypothetical protein
MKDQETKERFLELRAKGWAFDRIAQELKTSKPTLINWSRELQTDIANLKAIELESLQERFYMTKAQRIELFGERLQAIKAELDKRDLREIPSDKLLTLFITYFNILKNEATETVFRGTQTTQEMFNILGTDVTWRP